MLNLFDGMLLIVFLLVSNPFAKFMSRVGLLSKIHIKIY